MFAKQTKLLALKLFTDPTQTLPTPRRSEIKRCRRHQSKESIHSLPNKAFKAVAAIFRGSRSQQPPPNVAPSQPALFSRHRASEQSDLLQRESWSQCVTRLCTVKVSCFTTKRLCTESGTQACRLFSHRLAVGQSILQESSAPPHSCGH